MERLNASGGAAEALLTRAGFGSVMATGIVSVAGAELDVRDLSWGFAAVAFAVYAALLAALLPRGRAPAPRVEAFAAVAATAVLGSRLALDGDGLAARAFLATAALVWIATWLSVARTRTLGPATGTRLLAVVSTQSLAILAVLVRGIPAAFGIALLALGVALYVVLIARLPPSELRRGSGDVWIGMGALAISALAAAHVYAAAGGHALRVLTFALWVAATCWLPPLVFRELRWCKLGFEPKRWSTVFPLGMYSAATAAVAKRLGLHDLPLADVFLGIAIAAWLLTAAGALRPAVAAVRRLRVSALPDGERDPGADLTPGPHDECLVRAPAEDDRLRDGVPRRDVQGGRGGTEAGRDADRRRVGEAARADQRQRARPHAEVANDDANGAGVDDTG